MVAIFSTKCILNCWECPRECQMKHFIENLDEEDFKQQILSNVKAQAGMAIASGRMDVQASKQYVQKTFMALVCARQKYLETLTKN